MRITELKNLGAPFPAAEVQVSVKKKIARLVLVLLNPTMDFPLGENTTVKETATEIIQAARDQGLIDENTVVDVIDLDSLQTN